MGNNSIRSNIGKDEVISEIILILGADIKKEKGIIVFEGLDDLHFANGKFAHNVDAIESYSGKLGVIEIVNHFNDDRVIGVCDRDYEKIPDTQRIYYYDYSCLEIMIIACDEAFESFCTQCYEGKVKFFELRKMILYNLVELSCLRKMSTCNGWGINFGCLSIADILNADTRKLNSEELHNQLGKANNTLLEGINNLNSLIDSEISKIETYPDYLYITQGHDFVTYFQNISHYSAKSKKRMLNITALATALRCAYRLNDFKKSKLYEELELLEDKCGCRFTI